MTGQEVLEPITEMELLRQQLLQAQRLCSVGELASSVAHEFNNILTTIINFAKIGLRSQNNNSSQAQAFEKILRSGHRASAIVNSMLGFARNSSVVRELADVGSLLDEVLLLTEKDLAKHRIQIEKKYHARPKAFLVIGQIEQLLINLVINARQSMDEGGRLKIELFDNEAQETVEIRIADTGVGIPPEQLRRIFDPFYTTKTPDEQGCGGTGLGLSVCRQIIEAHQGRIRVESVVGKGSTFTVKLPKRLVTDELGL